MPTDSQLALTRIARVMRVEAVSPADNFFDLGGDSLAALELTDVLTHVFGRDVPIESVLAASTFGDLFDELGGTTPAQPTA